MNGIFTKQKWEKISGNFQKYLLVWKIEFVGNFPIEKYV